jgi:hypothetical protein
LPAIFVFNFGSRLAAEIARGKRKRRPVSKT